MSRPRLRAFRTRALCVAALALASVIALAAGVASGQGSAERTKGTAYAVLINVPGAKSSGTLTSPTGSYVYRDLVSVHAYDAGSAMSDERAYAHSDLTGVSLLGGVVTADSLTARSFADGRQDQATGNFGGSVTGLVVAGAAVSVQPGGQFEIPGIGYGAINERRVVRSDGAYRGSEVALHVHLSVDWHDLPAGTEILLGYAEAVATGHETAVRIGVGVEAAAHHERRPTSAAASPRATPRSSARRSIPLPASDGTPTDSGDGITPTGIEAPPPGGFTLMPPVDPAVQQKLESRRATCSPSPAARTTATTSATSAATRASTRAATCSRRRARRSSRCSRACSTTSAGTASAAGGCGSRTSNHNWFYYAHLSAFSPIAVDGAHVNAGDVVGFVGPHRRCHQHALPPPLRDPPGGQVVRSAV